MALFELTSAPKALQKVVWGFQFYGGYPNHHVNIGQCHPQIQILVYS